MHPELGIVLVGSLSVLTTPRRQTIWVIMLVAGAVLEVSAMSISGALSGAGLVALSSAVLARRKSSVVSILFGSIFLILFGGAVVATHARTENLELLRVELGSLSLPLARAIIPLFWVGLMLRIAVLPLWLSRIPGVGAAVTVGPGWISGLVFAERVATVWPQSVLAGCTTICVTAVGLYAGLMGFATIRVRKDLDWLCFVASGVGMAALASVWFAAETGPPWGQDLIIRTGALLLLLGFIERKPVAVSVDRGIRLAVLGFPLTGLYVAKMGILDGLCQFGVVPQMGVIVLWIVPLVAVFAGEDVSAPSRSWLPTPAQLIALLGVLYISLEGGMLFQFVAP